jgi:Activator of Hsp90 ATPase homolog 1-like protein
VPLRFKGSEFTKGYEMTGDASTGARLLGTLGTADGKGVVRVEDRFDADIDTVWSALTDPSRLASWWGEVEGDLRVGGEYRERVFASGWEGTGRVEACEARGGCWCCTGNRTSLRTSPSRSR